MASIDPLLYSLEEPCPVPWTTATETQLHYDYPFLEQDNTDENFVIRRYLETLWLPESFNPLSHLITSLRRITTPRPNSKSVIHPLHALLEPLLLPTRAASDKYRMELVQILVDGGGAGEQEEMMMWYAWNYEQVDDDVDEEKWRKEWLERLERRETMIQILLNMLKLSLPGPQPVTDMTKKKRKSKQSPPPETDEERLESYMDKIAVWQLTASLDELSGMGSSQGNAKADRHWTHVFCEDVVEPLFKAELPEQCALFRSKVFPTSPFSDAEDSDAETVLEGGAGSRAGSRARSLSRKATPVPDADRASSLIRSRSRSLSVTLAQDEASQRANFIEPKRQLSREVSMTRSFKEKPKVRQRPKPKPQEEPSRPKAKRNTGVTLVAETPVKRKHADCGSQGGPSQQSIFDAAAATVPSPPHTSSSSPGIVCIEDTPVLMRCSQLELDNTLSLPGMPLLSPLSDAAASSTPAPERAKMSSRIGGSYHLKASLKPGLPTGFKDDADADAWLDENADNSFTGSFGSPDVLLLGDGDEARMLSSPSPTLEARGMKQSTRRLSMRMRDAGEDYALEMETPTKKRVRRK
ncbi:hypothetical protein DFH11DRAFT_785139 [Phellopilus nigrolimitatus]|nr:hypothetical protein DFH11DRAFT_785139 [Phellopilus nigrolimitatus]